MREREPRTPYLRERSQRIRWIALFVLLGVGSSGCHQIYLGPELPEVSPGDLRVPTTKKPLNLGIACSFGAERFPQVDPSSSEASRTAVYADFREKRCDQLSTIVQGVLKQYASFLPGKNVDRLTIKLDVRGYGGFEGASLGRLTNPEGGVAMEAEYTAAGRPPVRHLYRESFYEDDQLFPWRTVPRGARQAEGLSWGSGGSEVFQGYYDEAEARIVRDMALSLVRDLQQGGVL